VFPHGFLEEHFVIKLHPYFWYVAGICLNFSSKYHKLELIYYLSLSKFGFLFSSRNAHQFQKMFGRYIHFYVYIRDPSLNGYMAWSILGIDETLINHSDM